MPESPPTIPRLCLITPPQPAPDRFAPALEAALAAGDVASLIIASEGQSPAALERIAEVLTPIGQRAGAAVLVLNDTRIMGRAKADGVHIDTGPADLRAAVGRLSPKYIVGAGGANSRHEAMTLGEAEPDYIFFGRLDGDGQPGVHARALELAAWWAPLFQIPAILMAGSSIDSVREAAGSGTEFVALRRAVWDHPEGPAAAVAAATRLLADEAAPA